MFSIGLCLVLSQKTLRKRYLEGLALTIMYGQSRRFLFLMVYLVVSLMPLFLI
jgi:hypothetical protein